MNDETAEVLEGLAAGQTVVVHPSDAIEDGSLVEYRDADGKDNPGG
jgi:HlyD family secretion protein